MKQFRQESELKVLIKNRETANVSNTNFLDVIIEINQVGKHVLKEPLVELAIAYL
jgi:hypothetical protein